MTFLGSNLPLAIAEPRLNRHFYGAGLGRCRNILSKSATRRRAGHRAHRKRHRAGPQDLAPIPFPVHGDAPYHCVIWPTLSKDSEPQPQSLSRKRPAILALAGKESVAGLRNRIRMGIEAFIE